MPIYLASCPDGTDRGCHKRVEIELDVEDLDDDEVDDYVAMHEIALDSCPACGSDYERDENGSIIV